jgi:hypothetical protein
MPPLPRPKIQSPAGAALVAEHLEWKRVERLRKDTWTGNGWYDRGWNANDGRNGGWRGNHGRTEWLNNDHWTGWTGWRDNSDWNTKDTEEGFWQM